MARVEIFVVGVIAVGAAIGAAIMQGGLIDGGAFLTAIVFTLTMLGLVAAAVVDHVVDRPVHNPNLPLPVPARSRSTRHFRARQCSDCGAAMRRAGTLYLCERCDRAPI
jgi:hypothetical protein